MTRIHPETGATLTRDIRPKTITVGSKSQTLQVPGWYPEGDGDSVHSGVDLGEYNAVYKKMRDEK